jgi:hypothetical protein
MEVVGLRFSLEEGVKVTRVQSWSKVSIIVSIEELHP